VRLDVLREGQDGSSGVDRVHEHPHGRRERGEKLLGTGDAVEEPGHRAEGVVDAGVGLDRVLQLLKDRSLTARRVDVARQQQDGQPVDRCQSGAGDHVERAGADGRGDGQDGTSLGGLGESAGDVHQPLLVAALDERQIVGVLVQRLSESGDVAVAEDPQRSGDQATAVAVRDAVLPRQVEDQGLGRCEAQRAAACHVLLLDGQRICSGVQWRDGQVTRAGRAG
jgi:hypothetical protein